MAMQGELIESRSTFQQLGARSRRQFLPQMREALLERQMQRELDEANEVAAPSAAMAKKDVLAGVDIKRRMRFPVQRAQSHKLRLISGATRRPVAPLQVLQQRKTLFQLLQFRIHGVDSCPAQNTERPPELSRQGWWERAESCGRPHKRSGQHTCRKGKTVGQDNRQLPHWNTSPCASQRCTVTSVVRSRANGGREESRLRNQRRSVEGSAI